MNLSKKIILASCACAAFLTGVYSCTVEERNVEEKDLFLCMEDSDCLSSSVCVGSDKDNGIAGRCRLKNQVDPCADHDNDGFMALDEKYIQIENEKGEGGKINYNCGSDSHPVDINDLDPDVYPGATEYCDNKDNNGDGCVDSKCMCGDNCNCNDNQSLCAALTENCIGRRDLAEMKDTMCSAKVAGALVCQSGEWKYLKAKGDPSGSSNGKIFYTINDFEAAQSSGGNSTCPSSTLSSKNNPVYQLTVGTETIEFEYVLNELSLINKGDADYCDDLDHDCNGQKGKDEGGAGKCADCASTLAAKPNKECRIFPVSGTVYSVHAENNMFATYNQMYYDNSSKWPCSPTSISQGKCKCILELECNGNTIQCPHDKDLAYFQSLTNIKLNAETGTTLDTAGWCEEVDGGAGGGGGE